MRGRRDDILHLPDQLAPSGSAAGKPARTCKVVHGALRPLPIAPFLEDNMENRTLEVIGIDGPFKKRPSGKFKRDGETPIMAKCTPYWIVRVLHGTVLHDHRWFSAEAANQFAASITDGRIVEEWHGGTGFTLVEKAPCAHNWLGGYCDLCGAVKPE